MDKTVLVNTLIEKKLTVCTAESCTGGLIASYITDIPGASYVFNEGFITYSNEAKIKLLGVKKDALDKFGAVSELVCRQMCQGARINSGSDFGLSTTGIAGPDGGSDDKPVGTVFVGLSYDGDCIIEKCFFSGDRKQVRQQAADKALSMLMDYLCNMNKS